MPPNQGSHSKNHVIQQGGWGDSPNRGEVWLGYVMTRKQIWNQRLNESGPESTSAHCTCLIHLSYVLYHASVHCILFSYPLNCPSKKLGANFGLLYRRIVVPSHNLALRWYPPEECQRIYLWARAVQMDHASQILNWFSIWACKINNDKEF